MAPVVNCDGCNEDFKLRLRKKKHGVSIVENYFTCTNCKRKYVAFVTDAECRKMQRDIAKYSMSADGAVRDRVASIRRELKPRMDRLKASYS